MLNLKEAFDLFIDGTDICINLEEGPIYLESINPIRVNIPKLMPHIPVGEPDSWTVSVNNGMFINDNRPSVSNMTGCNYYTLYKSTVEEYLERVRVDIPPRLVPPSEPEYTTINRGTRLDLICQDNNIQHMWVAYYFGKKQ